MKRLVLVSELEVLHDAKKVKTDFEILKKFLFQKNKEASVSTGEFGLILLHRILHDKAIEKGSITSGVLNEEIPYTIYKIEDYSITVVYDPKKDDRDAHPLINPVINYPIESITLDIIEKPKGI